MLQGETLKYLSPNVSKFDYIILLIKLIVAVTVIFISAKIYYELNKVESFPSYLSNLLFILVCVLIAWLYRIDFKYQFSEPHISARVRYNLLGFVNISAQLDDGQTQKIRLWNPTSSSLQLSEKYKLEFIFKASSDNSNTGCRVVVLDNAT